MDTLTSIKVFHKIVASGSFTRAADALGISVAMSSKHISHLERTLGTKLLHRNSRSVHLTEAGSQYHAQSLYAIEMLDAATLQAQGETDRPQGVLRITMPRWFANARVAGYLAEFGQRYPDVVLDLSLSNQLVDLVSDGFDLALRLSNDPKPSLITRPLGVMAFYLVASPDYIARHGMPDAPNALDRHLHIVPTYVKAGSFSLYHQITGVEYCVNPTATIMSNDTLMNVEMIRAGTVIGYAPSWTVEQDLASGALVRLLPDYNGMTVKLYAAYVDRAYMSAKVRAFIDFWVEKCAIIEWPPSSVKEK